MNAVSRIVASLFCLGTAVLVEAAAEDRAVPPGTSVTAGRESPFACDRMALSPAERTRHFDELGPMLRAIRKSRPELRIRELPDGYEFEWPSDMKTYSLLAEFANGERYCCPFFDVDVRTERELGSTWLRLTGREGTKDFIQEEFARWFQK